jgi:type II secretory pathway pseudopilin PulG
MECGIMKKTLTLKGFTLIELGIVIVMISILTGIIVPNLQSYIEDSEKASDYANAALIYNDVSLVISTDENAYLSFFGDAYDGSGSKTCQYPIAEMVKDKDGNWIQKWRKDTKHLTSVITRCSGVNYDTALALAARQGQGYDAANKTKELTGQNTGDQNWHGLHDPFGYSTSGKGTKRIIYTWEPVLADKTMNKADIQKKVDENKFGWGDGKDSNKYFTLLLCEKENLPVWDNNVSEEVGSKVPIRMRYNKGNKNPDKGKNSAGVQYLFSDSDYVWEWMITYNPETLEPEIFAGNGQGNLVRKVYPDVDSDAVIFDW